MLIAGLAFASAAVAGTWGFRQYRKRRLNIPSSHIHTLASGHFVPSTPKEHAIALVKQVDDRYQLLIHHTVDRLCGTYDDKQLVTQRGMSRIAAIPPLAKQRNRQAGYAGISIALFLTGGPLLVAIALIINLNLGYSMIRMGLNDMWAKRRLTARGRNAIVYLGILLSGYLIVQSIAIILGLFIEKFIAAMERESHERLVGAVGTLPRIVSLVRDGTIIECLLTEVQSGDVVAVHVGEVIPVDGEIVAGRADVEQHALLDGAQPAEKIRGDSVLASTRILKGKIHVKANQPHADTLVFQIADILNHACSHQSQMTLRGDELADKMVYPTVGLGMLVWPFYGVSSMLAVASAPMGSMLGTTTPITLMTYLHMLARGGILVKDGSALELMSRVDTVVFDKSGTLTLDQPTIVQIHQYGYLSEDDLLALAAAIDQHRDDSVAAAIRDAAADKALSLPDLGETYDRAESGSAAMYSMQRVEVGNQQYMALKGVAVPAKIQQIVSNRQAQGHFLLFLAVDGLLLGVIELQPTVRPEVPALLCGLRKRGLELAMLTDDQEVPAQAFATKLGIERVFANVQPDQKAQFVGTLCSAPFQKRNLVSPTMPMENAGFESDRSRNTQKRQVMYVGDGIDDLDTLKQTLVSVSIADVTTAANDAAQFVLMGGTLTHLDTLFDLAERFEQDLQAQYRLATWVPLAYSVGVFAFGWGIVSAYAVGYATLIGSIGLANRPVWLEARKESKQKLLPEI
ncbi:MAG: HAD-IC family P-type ATPase [Chloroflexota bacterium]